GQTTKWRALIVSLEEKLGHKRQEQASTGTNSSEAINYRVRMSEIEHQNELIAQRIDQLAVSIENNNKQTNENINQMIEATKENNEVLNNKIKSLKDNQNTLLDGLNGYLEKYFNTFVEKIILGFEKRTNEITEDFARKVKEIEDRVKQQNEKKQKNGTILKN